MALFDKRRPSRVALLVALAAGAAGCELIVDFDRTKIDGGGGDGAVVPDVTTQDVTQDVTGDVTGDVQQTSDAGDAGADVAADAAADASDGALDDGADASDGATE